ncbi:MAG: DUF4199 domain-containing protein [Janthinobacterium lividum]
MEAQKQQANPVEVGIRYGLPIALAGVLVDFLTRVAGISVLVYTIVAGLLALTITVVGIVFAHKSFRQVNGGTMTYVQGIVIALVMVLISSLISALFNYVYVNYVDPDFVARMKGEMAAFMERNRVPQVQIDQSTAKLDEMSPTPAKALLNGIKNGLIGGILFGAIISAFTKRKVADFE